MVEISFSLKPSKRSDITLRTALVVEWFFIKADCEQEIKSWDERYSFNCERTTFPLF